MSAAGIILSFDGRAIKLELGALFILAAAVTWGIENNCTRRLSERATNEIVLIKGLGSGLGALLIGLFSGSTLPEAKYIILIMLLGFVSYRLSINCYILAQSKIGAAKTGAFYSIAPFIGVLFSFIFLKEMPDGKFYFALFFMVISCILTAIDTLDGDNDNNS